MKRMRTLSAAAFLTGSAVYLAAEAIAASAWKDPAYSYAGNWISDLGSATAGVFQGRELNSPLNVVMNSGFIIQGLLFGVGVLLLSRTITGRTRTFTVVMGILATIGYVLVGTFHGSSRHSKTAPSPCTSPARPWPSSAPTCSRLSWASTGAKALRRVRSGSPASSSDHSVSRP